MSQLDLSSDQLLSTTRAVRKRLDFDRPVDDDLIRECVAMAMQSPSGSNTMTMQFVVVTDPAKRAAIGEIYGKCFDIYRTMDGVYAGSLQRETAEGQAQQDRVTDSAEYLAAHMADAPALVIACTKTGRLDGVPAMSAASSMGNVLPAMWSFMLAARARGLGTCWTTVGLMMEEQIADVVGIPFDSVQQAVLSPLAYTKGTDFKTAMRPDPDTIIHWNTWSS
ncbi:nitroreductase family protein [Ilumatobacter sp.]|uniref:nitroreductase family protein n=1 Tax=Ilumatobacter sp. TaxID=1967498 RepID=UPI0037516DB6